MSRAGVEAKPTWRAVPRGVQRRVADVLGANIVRGARVWGGYSPTPTFRLTLADGRRGFCKGTNHSSNEVARRALCQEERIYRELTSLIAAWAPRFYGAFQHDEWQVLVLEDVGPARVPPWTPMVTRHITHAYAQFHASTLGRDVPAWLPRPHQALHEVSWGHVAAEPDGLGALAALAALAGDQAALAYRWLEESVSALAQASDAAADLPGPYALLHLDTRSDNLRFTHGHLALFDWPWAAVGRPEFDVVAFAQSVTVEGGAQSEQVIHWYAEQLLLRADALDAAVAWLAAFFADVAWRPEVPGLPCLRAFQQQQLRVVLPWAARRLGLPPPTWTTAIP